MVIFHSYVSHYQRVITEQTLGSALVVQVVAGSPPALVTVDMTKEVKALSAEKGWGKRVGTRFGKKGRVNIRRWCRKFQGNDWNKGNKLVHI